LILQKGINGTSVPKLCFIIIIIIIRVTVLMVEAARTSETLVKFYQTTWQNNPEDSHLYKTNC
jgi:hypothetical protein